MTKLERQINAECLALGRLVVNRDDFERAIAQAKMRIAELRAQLPTAPAPKKKR